MFSRYPIVVALSLLLPLHLYADIECVYHYRLKADLPEESAQIAAQLYTDDQLIYLETDKKKCDYCSFQYMATPIDLRQATFFSEDLEWKSRVNVSKLENYQVAINVHTDSQWINCQELFSSQKQSYIFSADRTLPFYSP